jgi:hypothetical protein
VREEKDITIEGMDCLQIENIINDDHYSKKVSKNLHGMLVTQCFKLFLL